MIAAIPAMMDDLIVVVGVRWAVIISIVMAAQVLHNGGMWSNDYQF